MRRIVAIALSSALLLQASPLLAASAIRGARGGFAQDPVATGAINGVAHNSAGQTLPGYTVQVRNLETGQVVGTTTSDAAGNFAFPGLMPANYVVELVSPAGVVAGSSASIAVTTTTVTTTAALSTATAAAGAAAGGAAAGAGAAGGVSTALVVTSIAAAAGIAGIIVVARDDASPAR